MLLERRVSAAKVVGCVAAAAAVFLLAVSTTDAVRAQQPTPNAASPGAPDPFAEMRERRQREAQLRSVETRLRGAPAKRTEAETEALLHQVNQDFTRIQVLHNEIVRDISAAKPLDYKTISEAAGEINKRANRLKKFLVPETITVETDAKGRADLRGEEFKNELVRLCKRIENFVENPIFDGAGTIDANQSAKATSDLLRIIELSERLARDASKLDKPFKR